MSEDRPRGPPPRMDHTGGHKESQYQPEFGREILERIRQGQTVRQITADPDMPSYATFYQWLKVHPGFAEEYRSLREELAGLEIARQQEIEDWKPYWRAHRAKLGLGRGWVSGRRTTYTRKAAEAICRRIAAGETMSSVTADPAMPSARAIYKWLKQQPEFRNAYLDAVGWREARLEGEVWRIVDRTVPGGERAANQDIAWLQGRIGRLTPKLYRIAPPPEAMHALSAQLEATEAVEIAPPAAAADGSGRKERRRRRSR